LRMREVAAERGLGFRHRAADLDPKVQHIQPHILGVGAAVSAVDVDRDGWLDLYATSSDFGAPNALFRNRGDGRFEDVAERLGVADLNERGRGVSMGSIWGDVDNDGDEDLLVYRYGYLALLRNDGERFVEVTREAGLERWMNSNAATWIDYDRDGFLDLYVAGYFRDEHDLWNLHTTRIMHDSGEFATNGGNNFLFRNRGDLTFEDVTGRVVAPDRHWTFAVAAADFDGDGWQDLYLANDYGSEVLLRNRGGERLEADLRAGLEEDSKSGMAVAIGSSANDGRMALFVSNISSQGYIFHGNNLRVNRLQDAGIFVQQARGALVDAGWAWGAQFGDLDNDGWQDLVVVNGFISQDPDKSYWYDASKVAGGVGGILADAAHWSPIGDRSQSGYERSRVLWNVAGRRFVDVAEAVGVTDLLDGRAVLLVDLENRGVLDVVVANQKGPLLLYRNEPAWPAGERRFVELELEGTRSNRSAIGATVELAFGDYRQVQVVDGGSGFASQRDRRLHFGLGPGVETCSAVVRWPSGLVQELPALEPDRLHRILEPRRE
ncbi:MAG TPA: CRTAC1 family protein, partial [Planctomycetota bacterium]|nr:CRTAC1 family protein [Planctomycetota bacterium]